MSFRGWYNGAVGERPTVYNGYAPKKRPAAGVLFYPGYGSSAVPQYPWDGRWSMRVEFTDSIGYVSTYEQAAFKRRLGGWWIGAGIGEVDLAEDIPFLSPFNPVMTIKIACLPANDIVTGYLPEAQFINFFFEADAPGILGTEWNDKAVWLYRARDSEITDPADAYRFIIAPDKDITDPKALVRSLGANIESWDDLARRGVPISMWSLEGYWYAMFWSDFYGVCTVVEGTESASPNEIDIPGTPVAGAGFKGTTFMAVMSRTSGYTYISVLSDSFTMFEPEPVAIYTSGDPGTHFEEQEDGSIYAYGENWRQRFAVEEVPEVGFTLTVGEKENLPSLVPRLGDYFVLSWKKRLKTAGWAVIGYDWFQAKTFLHNCDLRGRARSTTQITGNRVGVFSYDDRVIITYMADDVITFTTHDFPPLPPVLPGGFGYVMG